MEKLYEIKDTINRAIEKSDTVKSGELKMGELEFLNLATDTIKNIDKICLLEEEEGEYNDGGSYGRGSSYANRGKHYVRGHYSRDGGRDGRDDRHTGGRGGRGGRGEYSRGGDADEMMEHVRMAIDAAPDEYKEDFQRFMRQLNS